jgi:hypothetical protein
MNKLILITLIVLLAACSSPVQTFSTIIQFDATCYDASMITTEITRTIENPKYVFIGTETTFEEIQKLKQNTCVVRTFKPSELSQHIEAIKSEFDAARDEKFQEWEIKRVIEQEDVTENVKEYLQDKHKEETLPDTTQSEYQLYVTPDADTVQELVEDLDDIQDIYDEALSWVWVSEEYLNGEREYWYTPEEFLTITPTLDTNPSPGDYASDCSEQANTLASLLIAAGYGEENVRVVLGLVDFDGSVGGHAWVEIYEDGMWLPLEATAGAYYYEDSDRVREAANVPYDYFQHHSYPVVEVWYYYNNAYYMDNTARFSSGTYPDNWTKSSESYLEDDLRSFSGDAWRPEAVKEMNN